MESTLDSEQVRYHETDSVEVSYDSNELGASSADHTPLHAPNDTYGSWAQYEQVQYQSTTVLQSSQTVTDQVSGQSYGYSDQQQQVPEVRTTLSVTEAAQPAISPAAQTYQAAAQVGASQAYDTSAAPAITVQDNVTYFTGYASVQTNQTAETAYAAPIHMQQPAPLSPQGLPGQPMYMAQTAAQNQLQSVPSTIPYWQAAQAPMIVQPQYTVQGGVQTSGSPFHTLQVGPDGQYHVLVPVTQVAQGPQTIMYQTGPNGVQYMTTQTFQPQPQSSSSGRKIWNKETAVQAKEATINATKKAYDKSKEFIVNKDGARAVAKTTWRQSKDVMVKTTDLMDKYVKPLMPVITAANPELAASLRTASGIGRTVKAQDRKLGQAHQAKNGPGMGPGGQNVAQPQLDAAALANLASLSALLQQTVQLNAVSGNQQDTDAQAQARLLATLLQIQQQQGQQPQIQQPQVQQPPAQQLGIQQSQQYHVQQPFAQQQPQPASPQPQAQQQVSHQQQQWQQQAQAAPIQQQQHIPRRKAVSSTSATQAANLPIERQPVAAPALSAADAVSRGGPESLEELLDSQLTLHEQAASSPPIHQSMEQSDIRPIEGPAVAILPAMTTTAQGQPHMPDADTWTHHAFPAFGIQDILLPPGSDITPSQGAPNTVTVGNPLANTAAFFKIEPFANSALLQRYIDALQSIPMSASPSAPPLETQLLEPLAVRPELNPSALVAADCLVGLSAGQRTSYKVLLQSSAPQGFGISIASTSAASATQSARDAVRRMAGSVQWATTLEENGSK